MIIRSKRRDSRVNIIRVGILLIVSISYTAHGQGPGRVTPKPSPKPPVSRRTPTVPAFRPYDPHIPLVRISPGSFMMGSTNGNADERPVHRVTINYSFYIGLYEVNEAQWYAVTGDAVSRVGSKVAGDGYNKPCFVSGLLTPGDCPASYKDWDRVKGFITKLNQLSESFTYRLPTEAEWEYVARAGATGDYTGDVDELAWYDKNSGDRVHAVGQKKPNAWGLYDLYGNVAEWCEDLYHDSYFGAPTDGSAWITGPDQKYGPRVTRGGYYSSSGADLRPTSRGRQNSYQSWNNIGFRVVAIPRTR